MQNSLKALWENNQRWLFLGWCFYGLFYHPGWGVFLAGVLVWILLIFFTAPGVFWTYAYYLPFGKTERSLEKAIAHAPHIPAPYTTAGITAFRAKDWPRAVSMLEKAAAYSSKKEAPQVKIILAAAYRENGDYGESLRVLDEVTSTGFKNMKISLGYALTYLKMENLPEALEAAKKARSLDINASEPVLLMGRIHFRTENYEAARNDYEWAIGHTSWPVESYYWLGRAELELGDINRAVEHLQKAVERITEDPELSDVTVTEAEEWLKKAESLQESLPETTGTDGETTAAETETELP